VFEADAADKSKSGRARLWAPTMRSAGEREKNNSRLFSIRVIGEILSDDTKGDLETSSLGLGLDLDSFYGPRGEN
jgi:hypothetical protein